MNQADLNHLMRPFEHEAVKCLSELHATLFVCLAVSSGIPLVVWTAFGFLSVRGGGVCVCGLRCWEGGGRGGGPAAPCCGVVPLRFLLALCGCGGRANIGRYSRYPAPCAINPRPDTSLPTPYPPTTLPTHPHPQLIYLFDKWRLIRVCEKPHPNALDASTALRSLDLLTWSVAVHFAVGTWMYGATSRQLVFGAALSASTHVRTRVFYRRADRPRFGGFASAVSCHAVWGCPGAHIYIFSPAN